FNFYDCLLLYFSFYIYFFCSSRRRDTNLSRDWSSDVCSSDLRPTCCATSPTSARAGRTFAWRWTSRASRTPERAAPMSWRAASRSEERRVGKESRYRIIAQKIIKKIG